MSKFISEKKYDGTRERTVARVLDNYLVYHDYSYRLIGVQNMEQLTERILEALDKHAERAKQPEQFVFQAPWRVACAGHEVPFVKDGKRYIYVWNSAEQTHYYYCFDDDTFIHDRDFRNL